MITRFISALYRRVAGAAGPSLLLPRGAGGTPLAGSGRNGRMRGFAGQGKQLSPHPPLRGTFSRGKAVGVSSGKGSRCQFVISWERQSVSVRYFLGKAVGVRGKAVG